MKKHIVYILIILAITAGSAIINSLPDKYIVSGSDLPFILNYEKHLADTTYFWSNLGTGLGSPDRANSGASHYLVGYPLKVLGFNDTQVLNVFFFLFIFLSAISAYFGLGILSKFKARSWIYLVSALYYAFNSFTIFGFTASWMYHPIYDVYVLLPLMTALFIRGLVDKNNNYLVVSILVFPFSLAGYSNPAFLIALYIFLMIIVTVFFLFGYIGKKQLLVAGIISILYLIAIAFYSAPLAYEFLFGYAKPAIGSLKNIKSWSVIKITSSKALHAMRLMNDNPTLFFPNNFPYFAFLKPVFMFLSVYPGILVALGIIYTSKKNRKIMLAFALSLIIFIYIAAKINFPIFQNFTIFLFNLPLLIGLRASDKTYPFIAFCSCLLSFYFLEGFSARLKNHIESKKIECLVLGTVIFVIIIFPLPFLLGKFQQTMTMDLKSNSFSHLVKVPDEYRALANFINEKDKSTYKIMHMPYTGAPNGYEAVSWSYYPKWRFNGSDITRYLFDQPVVNPIDPIGDFKYGSYINNNPNTNDLLNISRLLGTRYLLLDKYVNPTYYASFKQILKTKDFKSNFSLIKKSTNLELYRLNSEKELPQIYSSAEGPTIVIGGSKNIPQVLDRNNKPFFILSKTFMSKKPLDILNYSKNVIIAKGNLSNLVMDLLLQDINQARGIRFLIRGKTTFINIPFTGSFNIIAREEPGEKAKVHSNRKQSDWEFKGTFKLTKGKHRIRSHNKIQELVLIPENEMRKYVINVENKLVNKPVDYLISRKSSASNIDKINEKYSIKPDTADLKFSKINPTKYIINMKSKRSQWIIFSENYHTGWKAYYGKVNWWQALLQKPISDDKHFVINGFANAWYIEKPEGKVITLYYWPQSLFYIGAIMAVLLVIGCFCYLAYRWQKNK